MPPLRLKRVPFVDVIVESLNFPIRFSLGWYAYFPDGPLPPFTELFAIWSFGSALLTGKRAAELARINNKAIAKSYRPTLLHYTHKRSLVLTSLYGMIMFLSIGLLFSSFQPLRNLILMLPLMLWLFGIYLWKLADTENTAREMEPEKLIRLPKVWIAAASLLLIASILASI